MKNMKWMMIGCAILLLLIFFLPGLFPGNSIWGTLIIVALLAVCILPMLMMRRKGGDKGSDRDGIENSN